LSVSQKNASTIALMIPRHKYIDVVRNLYSLAAAAAQDDREGFIMLAVECEANLDRYVAATIVAMRNPITEVARRDQITIRTLLNDTGPLNIVPGPIRFALGRLHRDEDFDTHSLILDLKSQINDLETQVPDEEILLLGILVDSLIATWTLLVGSPAVIDYARRLLLTTSMLSDKD